MRRTDPEHWEKYLLLMVAAVSYVAVTWAFVVAVLDNLPAVEVLSWIQGALSLSAVIGLVVRKVSKYLILKSFEIGQGTARVEFDQKEADINEKN